MSSRTRGITSVTPINTSFACVWRTPAVHWLADLTRNAGSGWIAYDFSPWVSPLAKTVILSVRMGAVFIAANTSMIWEIRQHSLVATLYPTVSLVERNSIRQGGWVDDMILVGLDTQKRTEHRWNINGAITVDTNSVLLGYLEGTD